jgi:hypothetical protein
VVSAVLPRNVPLVMQLLQIVDRERRFCSLVVIACVTFLNSNVNCSCLLVYVFGWVLVDVNANICVVSILFCFGFHF